MNLRRAVTLIFILTFGVLVQAATVCHVVTCSLPADPPSCHHETSDPETCSDFAAAAGSIALDFIAAEFGAVAIAEPMSLAIASRAVFASPSPPPLRTVLRI